MSLELSDPVTLSDTERASAVELAVFAALQAGREVLPYFRADVAIENKASAGFDPVTEADRAAESAIRAVIRTQRPADGLFGEEYGLELGQSGLTWVIDPIDGTRSFMSGALSWGVLIALFDGQEPQVGVLYQPYTDEMFVGDSRSAELRRGGAHRALRARTGVALSDATMATTGTDWFTTDALARFDRVAKQARMVRYGGDCYLYSLLAMGYTDLAVESGLNAYDIQALIPIIRGAGGVIENWQGGSIALGGNVVAAGSEALLREAQALLA